MSNSDRYTNIVKGGKSFLRKFTHKNDDDDNCHFVAQAVHEYLIYGKISKAAFSFKEPELVKGKLIKSNALGIKKALRSKGEPSHVVVNGIRVGSVHWFIAAIVDKQYFVFDADDRSIGPMTMDQYLIQDNFKKLYYTHQFKVREI